MKIDDLEMEVGRRWGLLLEILLLSDRSNRPRQMTPEPPPQDIESSGGNDVHSAGSMEIKNFTRLFHNIQRDVDREPTVHSPTSYHPQEPSRKDLYAF